MQPLSACLTDRLQLSLPRPLRAVKKCNCWRKYVLAQGQLVWNHRQVSLQVGRLKARRQLRRQLLEKIQTVDRRLAPQPTILEMMEPSSLVESQATALKILVMDNLAVSQIQTLEMLGIREVHLPPAAQARVEP